MSDSAWSDLVRRADAPPPTLFRRGEIAQAALVEINRLSPGVPLEIDIPKESPFWRREFQRALNGAAYKLCGARNYSMRSGPAYTLVVRWR